MSDQDLARLRNDLATLKRAAGLELPFGPADVRASLALGCAGVVAVVWALIPHGLPHRWGMVPLVVLAIGHVVRMRVKSRRSTATSSLRRREYTLGLIATAVFAAAMLGYRVWGTAMNIPVPFLQAAAMCFAGLALVLPACTDRGRIHWLALAVPILLCAAVIPMQAVSPFVPLGAAFAIGGAAMAGVQTIQLRRDKGHHDAD